MPFSKLISAVYKTWEEIPPNVKLNKEFTASSCLIDGKIEKIEGELINYFSPIHIKRISELQKFKLGTLAKCDSKTAIRALNSAKKAYARGLGEWSRISIAERAKSLNKFIDLLHAKRDTIVKLILWETGKSLTESNWEFDRTIDYIKKTVKQALEIENEGKQKRGENGFTAKLWRAPLGVVLCSGPANYPLFETYSLVMPSLIMGNCVVFKAPSKTPLMHAELLEDLNTAFPKGVINVLFGDLDEIINPIIKTGDVDAFIYMGSYQAIENAVRMHPYPYRFKTILGLNAKNVGIVAESASVKNAARDCALGAYAFNGQRCAAIKIIFVHSSLADRFKKAFLEELENTKIGMPWEDGVRITPLQSQERIPFLKSMIDEAIQKGASLLDDKGGAVIGGIMLPAALWDVKSNTEIYKEEQFAPITPIVLYDNIEEPLNYLANTNYGQQLSFFTENKREIDAFLTMARGLVGRININHKCQRGPDAFPFTARKNSGNAEFSIRVTLEDLSVETVLSSKDEKFL